MEQEAGGRQRAPGIVAYLFAELRQAFRDIRQKVFEEGWFGRAVTPAPVIDADKSPASERGRSYRENSQPLKSRETLFERRHTFEEFWSPRERAERPQDHSPDKDIDR